MKKLCFVLYYFSICATSVSGWASTQSLKQVTGSIREISSDSFSIQSPVGVVEFPQLKNGVQLPKSARVGDSIHIWYTPNIVKIEIYQSSKKRGDQPGQVAPPQHFPPILDDRAFYSA